MKKIITLTISIFFALSAIADNQNIIAIVNETPITKHEFDARKKMAMFFLNVGNLSSAAGKQFNKDILNSLIDGELLKQYAKKDGIKISNEEIKESIASLEDQNGMPRGQLPNYLASNGISVNSFIDHIFVEKIKSNIAQSISGEIKFSQNEFEEAIIIYSDKDLNVDTVVFSANQNADYNKMDQLRSKISCNNNDVNVEFADKQLLTQNLKAFSGRIQSVIKDTKIGEVSRVFRDNDDKFKILLVCKKHTENLSDNDLNKIKYFLSNKKLGAKTEKLLINLRSKAYIKILDSSL